MRLEAPTYDDDNPQSEGIYWCQACQRNTQHSLYDSQDIDFYEHCSDEELAAIADEGDILKCDRCVDFENSKFTDG